MIVFLYPDKKTLKASIGKPLRFLETSVFGPEYRSNGQLTGAGRPHITRGCFGSAVAREFFATVTLANDRIVAVK